MAVLHNFEGTNPTLTWKMVQQKKTGANHSKKYKKQQNYNIKLQASDFEQTHIRHKVVKLNMFVRNLLGTVV